MSKYLDLTGLTYFWQKIKAYGNSHWGGGGSVLSFYPIGSYYETSDTTFNPNTEWGGTWELELAGQVHVSSGTGYAVSGAGTNTSDGGSKDAVVVSHNHTQNSHNHTQNAHSHTAHFFAANRGSGSTSTRMGPYSYTSYPDDHVQVGYTTATNIATTATNNATGVDGTDKNMPPYIVVNRWHRTA